MLSLAVPWPPDNGHRLRNWGLLNALHRSGHDVHLVSFADRGETAVPSALGTLCERVTLLPLPLGHRHAFSMLMRAATLATPWPSGVIRLYSARLSRLLRAIASGYDVVFADDVYSLPHVPRSIPVMLNKHDITHIIARRLLTHEPGTLRRLYTRMEARKLQVWESRACGAVTGVLACSEHDRRLLETLAPGARVAVAPNVIDVDGYRPAAATQSMTMLYVGSMDWLPNRDAVDLFASSILPRVRARVPNAEFRVVGRAASPAFRRRLESIPGVVFTGAVESIQDSYREAAVCVVPLRIGSGTRLKILEAAAMARPVVSTTIGAEGLTLRPGREILIEDDPAAFAAEVVRCLQTPALRTALGAAARRHVEDHYSFGALQRHVDAALREFFGSEIPRCAPGLSAEATR